MPLHLALRFSRILTRWYLGHISRIEAEKNLLQPGVQRGMFIVRDSESNPGAFSISIIDHDSDRGNNVKHYEIEKRDDDETGSFYIHERASFPTLAKLIKHHQLLYFFKGIWKEKTTAAIKTLKMGTSPSEFLSEANIMKNLRHLNLCQLCGICSDKESIYIVMEWMCNGSLLNYLKDGEGRNLELPGLVDIGAQIASGMAYLESMNYIHRQLAARNVLIGDANIVKVADFRLAKRSGSRSTQCNRAKAQSCIDLIPKLSMSCISVSRADVSILRKWTAPEVLMHKGFSIKSDVWSFGILLTELVTHGQTPYLGMTNEQAERLVGQGYRMPKMANCPDALYVLMLMCWDNDSAARPTFEFLYSYLDNYSSAEEPEYKEAE
ncbi:tyrosine-protein kinase fyna-like [Patiria miniata]|uniref:Tyrosine-protein kinase n=1 Tax=Patiria miniata TaxID=46514 RepID=A0A914BAI3_PATMI|nr:tyrosine-protein kinase fyna-like [Patiria miniata]